MQAPAWFQTAHPSSPLRTVAYFSMEYMLSEALPIYSGGLGNVAGDQLKAASDLGVPVVAIGLLYQQGYFRQELDAHGDQQVLYPVNEPGQLPIRRVRTSDGELLRMALDIARGQGLDSYVGGAGRTNQAVLAGCERSGQSAECQSVDE